VRKNLPLRKPYWRNSSAWRPNVALYHRLSDLHGMAAAMWASWLPPPVMARPRVRELSP
jgi:hypothetical protein